MNFCIPKNIAQKLKESAMNGQVNLNKLVEMDSAKRAEYLSSLSNKEVGEFLNKGFEKALRSKREGAIIKWVEENFKGEAKEKAVKKLKEKELTEKETELVIQELIEKKYNIEVKPEEIAVLEKKAQKIEEAQQKLGEDIGNITEKPKENLEFFKAKKEMDDYISSIVPASKLKIATSTIGRGMMLASVKSPILNIGSNTVLGITEALSRRLANKSIKTTDGRLAMDYFKNARQIYKETGYDVSRMLNAEFGKKGGENVMGEISNVGGEGVIPKVGKVVEDIVFKNLMGAPDAAFASAHFADSLNLNALKVANGNKALAVEFMKDAMRLEPKTPEGTLLRTQAVLDAQVATWTNKTWASKTSEGIRKILNEVSGDVGVGDYLLPFIKTPANVVATSMDYAGLGGLKAVVDTVKAIKNKELGSKEYQQNTARNIVRSGLGLTAALAITSQLKDDDFVGAYDPRRSQVEQLRNSNYNAVKIGDKWVSLDWFGPLAVPIAGIMLGRKYSNSTPEAMYQYAQSVASQAQEIPGIKEMGEFFSKNLNAKNKTLDEKLDETKNYVISELSSRLIPSIVSDIATATDDYQRKTTKGLQALQAKIPGLRQKLPVKTDIFGREKKTEGLSQILFGSRVKTSTEDDVVKEINSITQLTDKPITFTDWDKSSMELLAQFRQSRSEAEFNKAKKEYGTLLQNKLKDLFNSAKYQNATDEEKLSLVNNQDSEAMKDIMRNYGFRKNPLKKK